MEPESPRRWLLVKREQGVPDKEDSASRWSVDHVFVDQDAVPTLVEVKRSTDTRIRREVVGQMLDYAANGVRYWPPSELRAAFEETQAALGVDPAVQIQELCRDSALTLDEFFDRVEDNLRAGRIRMVFVADVIPDELNGVARTDMPGMDQMFAQMFAGQNIDASEAQFAFATYGEGTDAVTLVAMAIPGVDDATFELMSRSFSGVPGGGEAETLTIDGKTVLSLSAGTQPGTLYMYFADGAAFTVTSQNEDLAEQLLAELP